MYGALQDDLAGRLARAARGRALQERARDRRRRSRAHVEVEGRGELLNLCANNYLGLADHPDDRSPPRTRRSTAGASAWPRCGSSAARRRCTASSRSGCRRSSAPRTRSSSAPASTRTAASSRRCSARRTRSSPTRSTTPRSSTASGSARRARLRYANGDMDELEARLARGGRRPLPADRDRRRLLDGRLPRQARRDLRPRRAPRRARDGRRLARRRLRRARAAAARPSCTASSSASTSSPARSARRWAARSGGYVSGRARDRRAPAPALPALPLLEQRRAAGRRGEPPGARPDRGARPSCATALRENTALLPRAHDRARLRRPPGRRTRSCR